MNPLVEEAAATTGTSPEVLQHYLTAEIELETPDGRATLAGFAFDGLQVYARREDWYSFQNQYGVECYPFEDVRPVLRPFSALCTPLDDGTGRIPAVEVAKLALSLDDKAGPFIVNKVPWRNVGTAKFRRNGITVSYDWKGSEIIIGIADTGSKWSVVVEEPAMGNHSAQPDDYLGIFDYLRQLHFALPVNGRPLIEGVDYLPK